MASEFFFLSESKQMKLLQRIHDLYAEVDSVKGLRNDVQLQIQLTNSIELAKAEIIQLENLLMHTVPSCEINLALDINVL
jgi:hypothetical protein